MSQVPAYLVKYGPLVAVEQLALHPRLVQTFCTTWWAFPGRSFSSSFQFCNYWRTGSILNVYLSILASVHLRRKRPEHCRYRIGSLRPTGKSLRDLGHVLTWSSNMNISLITEYTDIVFFYSRWQRPLNDETGAMRCFILFAPVILCISDAHIVLFIFFVSKTGLPVRVDRQA